MRKIPIGEWEGIEYQARSSKRNECAGCIGFKKVCCSDLSDDIKCGGSRIAKRHVTIAEYKAYKDKN